MKYVFLGASIECNGAKVTSRDIQKPSHINDPKAGQCKLYKCDLNSKAEIIKELNPKKAKIDDSSGLNLGDSVSGFTLTVMVDARTSLEYDVKKTSHRHKGQHAKSNKYTYAKVSALYPNSGELKDKKQLDAIEEKKKLIESKNNK